MKKIFILPLLVITLLLTLVGCGNNTAKTEEADAYSTDFDKIYNDIQQLNTYSDSITKIISLTWNEAGPNKIANQLDLLLKMDTSLPETAMEYGDLVYFIEGNLSMDYIYGEFTLENKQKADAIITEYQTAYNELSTLDAKILTDLKDFKTKYNEEHPEAVAALTDYYTESSSFANLALNPSGSLLDYQSNVSTFLTSIDSLKKAADLSK